MTFFNDKWYNKPIKKLVLDIDGVIAGFEEAFSRKFNLTSPPTDWNDVRYTSKLEELKNDKDFWVNEIQPLIYPHMITYPIAGYCTARSIPLEWIEEWLDKHLFPNAPILKVEFGESKVDKLNDFGCDVMADDSINNFIDLNSNGINCYLITRSHNFKYNVGEKRMYNLLELLDILKL